MSDARWHEIENDIQVASKHFDRAVEAFRTRDFDELELNGYLARMGFMHAMQAGHTSLETALLRILELCNEPPPTGAQWHADLIARIGDAVGGRPPVLNGRLRAAADATRRFRNIATRGYEGFERDLAEPAVLAAQVLIGGLPDAIARFRRTIDP